MEPHSHGNEQALHAIRKMAAIQLTVTEESSFQHQQQEDQEHHPVTPPKSIPKHHHLSANSPRPKGGLLPLQDAAEQPQQQEEEVSTPIIDNGTQLWSPPDEKLDAYALDPHMAKCTHVEEEFERVDAKIFQEMAQETERAKEQARVSELKNEEAVAEAAQWAHVKLEANKERDTAKTFMAAAEAELAHSQQLWEEAEAAKATLDNTTDDDQEPAEEEADPVVVEGKEEEDAPKEMQTQQQQLFEPKAPQQTEAEAEQADDNDAIAAQFLAESSLLRQQVDQREQAIIYLSQEAAQLEALAESWARRVYKLENMKTTHHQHSQLLQTKAEVALHDAQHELEVAEAKRDALLLENAAGDDVDMALRTETAALAERADIKATGAEIQLEEAIQAAAQEERIESALTQARRDAELLLRRAGELLATAEAYIDGQDTLLQLAYEKACRAYDLVQHPSTTETTSETPQTPPKLATVTEETQTTHDKLHQHYQRIKTALAESEAKASELLAEARKHAKASLELEADATLRADHVKRVLKDAATAQAREEEALLHARELAAESMNLTGIKLTEQWSALTESKEWQEALQGVSEEERILLKEKWTPDV